MPKTPLAVAIMTCAAFLMLASAGSATQARMSADVTGTISPGGSAVTVTIATAGDNARIAFQGTANQRISLNITNVSIALSWVSILEPDGSTRVPATLVGTPGKFIDVTTLPATGTYTIFIDPDSTYTGSMTLNLYDVPQDPVGSGAVDSFDAVSLETTVPGQNSKLTFTGSAGQQIYVMRTDVTTSASTVKVLAPNGSVVSSSGLVSSADGDHGAVLPSDGTYTVLVDGFQAASGRMSLDVSSEEEVPGVYLSDQSADTGTDEVASTPVAPTPMSPSGPVAAGTYETDLWDTESTEVPGGLQVVSSTSSGTASVTGVALNEDVARAPVANATVTLTDGSGATTTTTTDAQGGFAFIDMPPSTYSLTISAPPLGLYRVINDLYAADTNSQLTAFMGQDPVTIDESQQPNDSDAASAPTPRAYPSFSRIPPTIRVLDVKPDATCAATVPDSSASITTYNWKFYVLHVAENEVANQRYNQSAFKAFALAVSNYAWYYKIYPRDYIPSTGDIDNSTHFQCFRTGRISDKRWAGWVNEALRYRIVKTTPARPWPILDTEYKAGSSGTCADPHAGVSSNELNQKGLKWYSEHCSYSSWQVLMGVYYPNSSTVLVDVPVRPIVAATRFSDGIYFTFSSSVKNPSTHAAWNVAWGYVLSRKVGTGPWRTIFVSRWDEKTRTIANQYVFNTNGCARYRAAAWNPRVWNPDDPRKSKWSNVNGGNPIGPSGTNC